MSGILWEVVATIALSIFGFFVPLGRHSPVSIFARIMFVAAPIGLLVWSQYLWATTEKGLLEHGTCAIAPKTKSCLSPEAKKVANFNQICPAALTGAHDLDWVPYVAKLPTLNPEPRGDRRYTCRAEGRGKTYLITVLLRCGDFADYRCVLVEKVELDSGEVLWDRSGVFN